MKNEIYLDYNATTDVNDTVRDVMMTALTITGNPSSVHSAGRKSKRMIEDARVQVAALAGCRARDVVFTSGGTESNNLALLGCPAKSYFISPIEHEAVLATAKELSSQGKPVSYLKLDSKGQIDLDDLACQLAKADKPALISVMMVNNEIGLIQDLQPIIALAREHGAFVHSDCVQAAGKIHFSAQDLDLDYLSLSAHKIHGPKGAGALIMKSTAPLKAQVHGGGQELGRRSGTENLHSIVGFGQAALLAMESVMTMQNISVLRDKIETTIRAYANDAVIIGDDFNRTSNVTCIAMPGTSGETQVMHMDLMGICVSSGSACSSGKVKTSHVLTALGYNEEVANSSIRVSLAASTTDADIDAFIKAWCQLYDRKKAR